MDATQLFDLRCGRRGIVVFREFHRGNVTGAIARAGAVLRESKKDAAECQTDVPEVSSVEVYRLNVGPSEAAGWSHTRIAVVRRGRKTEVAP